MKQVPRADSVDLAIACYSLALNFMPPQEKVLKATILSNRSLMYKKQGKAEDALNDAQQCVLINPSWSKVSLLTDVDGKQESFVAYCGCWCLVRYLGVSIQLSVCTNNVSLQVQSVSQKSGRH